ncbi:MAG: hypothetical protein WDM79_16915 [Terricaulis sp.]
MSDVATPESLFGFGLMHGYKPLPGVSDEMIDADGAIRPHWRIFLSTLGLLGQEEIESRFEQLARRLRATVRLTALYDAPGGGEAPVAGEPLAFADERRRMAFDLRGRGCSARACMKRCCKMCTARKAWSRTDRCQPR